MAKAIIKTFLLLIATLFIISFIRTLTILPEDDIPYEKDEKVDLISDDGLSERLAEALKFQTISYKPLEHNEQELIELADFIKKSFPLIHSSAFIKREIVNKFSLLYIVEGLNPKLKPYMLTGHLDVVPVDENEWEFPPFSGQIDDGYIIGRGAIDAKDIVLGTLEALELLLKDGFHPQRTLILAYGHDEEISGYNGAAYINELLSSRNVKLEYLLDEGNFIISDIFPGVETPAAYIGVTEKGSANIKLSVTMEPGHSSVPKVDTAIYVLAKAISKLHTRVFPSMLGSQMDCKLFGALVPYSSFYYKILYANLWLFAPLLSTIMSHNPILNSLLRTTVVPTVISGGEKYNVLPSSASVVLNVRFHPLQSITQVYSFIKDVINDDKVEIEVIEWFKAHPISPFSNEDFGFATIKKSINQVHSDIPVLPTVLVAKTDTRWYLNLTNAIYRFSPVELMLRETSRFHGNNEKIAISNYIRLVQFYIYLIKNSDKEKLDLVVHEHSEL